MRRTHQILIFLLLLLGAPPVLAAPRLMDPPEPVDRSVARIPSSAEMVVVIDGLTVARNLPAASGLFGVLNDLGLTEELKPHWAALSSLLGWSETETLDRLLGSRIVLAVAALDQGRETPWVILSDISAATDQQVKARIPIAARKAVDGHPVFALERGDYEIATLHTPGAPEDRVTLLLGPARRAAMFDVMIRALSKGITDTLGKTPVVRELAGHTSPGVLVAIRIDPEKPGAPRAAWDDFLICTAAPKGQQWDCRVAIRDAGLREHVRRIEPSSDAPFRAMSRHSMLAILETRLAAPGADPSNVFERMLALFNLPDGAEGMLTGRQAIAVWPRGGNPKDRDAASTALCCAVALETSDVEKMAPIGDKHLGKLVEQVERAFGGPGLPIPDFAGVSCQAVRSVPLELPAEAPVQRVFDGKAQIAWSYPAAPAPVGAASAARAGWWQVCVAGAGKDETSGCERGGGACADASRLMVEALLQPPAGGDTDRWVSIGSMRPTRWAPIVRMVAEGLKGTVPQAPNLVRMLERIDRIEWRLAARDNDDVVGTMRIEMALPK